MADSIFKKSKHSESKFIESFFNKYVGISFGFTKVNLRKNRTCYKHYLYLVTDFDVVIKPHLHQRYLLLQNHLKAYEKTLCKLTHATLSESIIARSVMS